VVRKPSEPPRLAPLGTLPNLGGEFGSPSDFGAEVILKIFYAICVSLVCVLIVSSNLQAQVSVAASSPASSAAPAAAAPSGTAPAVQNKRASDYLNEELPHWLRLSGEYGIRGVSAGGIGFKGDNHQS